MYFSFGHFDLTNGNGNSPFRKRMKHIEFSTLIEDFEGRVPEKSAPAISEHLAVCSACLSDSAKVAQFFAYAGSQKFEPVPQAATANILNIYKRRPKKSGVPSPGRSFLVFDDWTMAVNERFSGSESRQLLFEVGNLTIDLRLEFQGENCSVSGQIFPDAENAAISIISAERSLTGSFGEFGEFVFDPAPQDLYEIRISIASTDLSIPEVSMLR